MSIFSPDEAAGGTDSLTTSEDSGVPLMETGSSRSDKEGFRAAALKTTRQQTV